MIVVERRTVVRLTTGLHARPAAKVVGAAQRFQAELTLEAGGRTANLKSTLSVLALGVLPDTEVILRASGPDAEEAADALEALLTQTDL
ncbi:HPr family phosphocarrier protein [Symbiobacterium thermophilum]|uniref:Phosphocarrier protein HPr n=1 Tax=Symbiobacterium thermophilum TaxID=2734 RepID=A0A953IAG4_SYMTR|nr:HPr family phosphocarrier protein [Symbiobacterium thermophilum]MBY6277438.1 HPr family phosphocarrier protein [Symbiobacterium thermophilum]